MSEQSYGVRPGTEATKKKARLENQPGLKSLGRGCLKGTRRYVGKAVIVQVRKEQGFLKKTQG
tara:strand:- start:511 stop:699 length:189 start_codon:yes stop_codon:yes gene_type:complete